MRKLKFRISISPGFIAHYDLQGFKDEYSNVHDFYNDIMDNKPCGIRVNYQPSEKIMPIIKLTRIPIN